MCPRKKKKQDKHFYYFIYVEKTFIIKNVIYQGSEDGVWFEIQGFSLIKVLKMAKLKDEDRKQGTRSSYHE